ncbi:membrane bound O-acyl transferase MBOAT family protein [Vibrio nigripulchritudo ATCC 27043]|uniref:MBOAT family O-acyltransferase n=1 Tax=Vibrio nigripulchritudo TaxID=28173 RepID=UPI00021C3B1C|nr:MBOAT family protein [Vibrio nigripulchritudo]EGU60156.1 membrane bound O-acyl transferase MBOAT family protein [Vibrio nigripulchritudo ATCC 27043]
MLFNSYIFIFLFLPLVILGFYFLTFKGKEGSARLFLVSSSLFFYGWWNYMYLAVIIASLVFNFLVGVKLRNNKSRLLLTFSICVNLIALVYYKYFNFFIDSINYSFNLSFNVSQIILPLAISFFTFQQISYLVDVFKGSVRNYSLLDYSLFVTFFPQLIAGPIVHHNEIMPQFKTKASLTLVKENLAIGITIFIFGLFKKVVLADSIATYATPIFLMAEDSQNLNFYTAWFGALSYSFQLYFDFSGYSDMAIGLARMFGIILPLNFMSPYKSLSIIEFWRRWHITLSRFLRDYVYIYLGGNRHGEMRRRVNLFITMLLGGLWHGAGWTFVLWGGYHGLLLTINHLWRKTNINLSYKLMRPIYFILTFLCVVIGWVIFRSNDLHVAFNMYFAMFDFVNINIPDGSSSVKYFVKSVLHVPDLTEAILTMTVMIIVAFFLPNTIEFINDREEQNSDVKKLFTWKYGTIQACILAIMTITCIVMMSAPSEFLYFQF